MNAMARESWTDERLDDFKQRVNQRFDEMNKRFDKVDARLERIDGRIDSLTKGIMYGSLTLSSVMIAGFVAILTQV
jgi:tetrahydromethanopterin S-methyltransferase subunit G